MNEQVKPRARCECRDDGCPEARDPAYARIIRGPDGQCPNDAVRLVEVWEMERGEITGRSRKVALCAPCADFHEKGAAK